MRPDPNHSRTSRSLAIGAALALAGVVALPPAAHAAPLRDSVTAPHAGPGAGASSVTAEASGRRLGLPRASIALRAAAADARGHLPTRGPLVDVLEEWRTCERSTPVSAYVARQAARMDLGDQLVLSATFADRLPMWEAMMRTAGDPRVAVAEHGPALVQTLRRLQGFWDVDGRRVELVEMRGTMLTDPARVQATYEGVLGFSPAVAKRYTDVVVHWARTSRGADRGRNPLLTFNAFAVPAQQGTAPRIVMGQGLVQAQDDLGFGAFGSQLVLAHEYGHQVQFAQRWTPFVLDVRGVETVELHADASAGYFATHARGLGAGAARVATVERAFHGIGDCAVIMPGHHGTPAQRGRAATWGVQQAVADRRTVATAASFRSRFMAALPTRIVLNPRPVARH